MNEDSELLVGLSDAELQALADSAFAPAAQTHVDELLSRQAEAKLTEEATAELDRYLQQVDQLTILKTRARYTLRCQNVGATAT